MRKPSAPPPRRIVQVALAVLAFSACDSASRVDGKATSDSAPSGSGAVGGDFVVHAGDRRRGRQLRRAALRDGDLGSAKRLENDGTAGE